jgi:uncharacterized Zn-binding protein involved in type VI secretion
MPGWVRKGDVNGAGAPVIANMASTVIVNGRNAALRGSIVASHGLHVMPTITVGSATVIVENRPPAFLGAEESCGHTQAEASGDVIVPGA